MPSENRHPFGVGYSRQAQDLLRDQQLDMEMAAAKLRHDPQLQGLTAAEGRKLAEIFDSAARVFRAQGG